MALTSRVCFGVSSGFDIGPLVLEEPVRSTAEAAGEGWAGRMGELSRSVAVGLDLVGFVPCSRVTLDPGIGSCD